MVIGFTLGACNPIKHIPEGSVYLQKNKINIPRHIIEPDELYPYIRQKANTKSLWVVKYKMQQYLSFNQEKVDLKNEKKHEKIEAKNEKRIAKGKEPKDVKDAWSYTQKEDGEEPVVFEVRSVKQTTAQFEKALFNIGYFQNKVFSELKYNSDSNKVTVIYSADLGPRFHLNTISLVINDPEILEEVKIANKETLLHAGDPYLSDMLENERLRLTSEMRNQGYFYFQKEYVEFEVDSTLTGELVDIKTIIKSPSVINSTNNEQTILSHLKYTIGQITLNTSFDPNVPNQPEDSIHFENLTYENLSKLDYNPHAFVNKLFFSTGEYYSQKNEERTYSRLTGLGNFSYINLGFNPNAKDSTILDCKILMSPISSQTIGIEAEGTHNGSPGVAGYLSYTHRNLFGSFESLKIRFKGGFELQQGGYAYTENNLFEDNTIEYGVETSLIFQELWLPRGLSQRILKRFNRPKTGLNFVFNNQKRPDFKRKLLNVGLGYYATRKKKNTTDYIFFPVDITFVDMDLSDSLSNRLETENNPLLNSTYSDQFIFGAKAIQTWTNRQSINQKSFILNRAQIDIAGNLLSLFDQALENNKSDSGDYYEVAGIRYAQFLKVQNDWHFNKKISRNQSLAYRLMGGIGMAYGNSDALPYDRSFYGGGANDNRGWRARTLGPGSYPDTEKDGIDQVADIKLQVSAEYRFTIVKSLEGTFFADVGNIWLRQEDVNRPNAHFEFDRFMTELAIGSGPGLRFNFGFLLVRFDWGLKIYNPGKDVPYRWIGTVQPIKDAYGNVTNANVTGLEETLNNSVLNLGIGYPF